MDRLRHLIVTVALPALALGACGKGGGEAEPKPVTPTATTPPVPEQNDPKAAEGFCDKHWPGVGATSMPFSGGPARRPFGKDEAPPAGAWRWVNYWATWCVPCLEEMPLLGRWRDALVKEGTPLSLELWSVDEDEAKLRKRVAQGMPGAVSWVTGPQALADYLGKLGMSPDSMLPIQMLVDPNDKLRCVRVGAVSAEHYPTIRRLMGL